MSIFDNIVKAVTGRRQTQLPLSTSSNWLVAPQRTTEGFLQAYGEIGWLFAVCSKIAIGISEVEWHTYKETASTTDPSSEREEIYNHVLLDLLNKPNPFQSGVEFMELSALYMELTGESFWYKVNNNLGVPAELWLLPPHRIEVVPDQYKYIKGYVYTIGLEKIPLEYNQIIHFKTPNPYNPYRGLGAAQAASIELDTEQNSAKWNNTFYYNDARPDGILRISSMVSDDDYKRLKEDWLRKFKGVANAHKTAIIRGEAMDYARISLSQTDMDFFNSRHLTRDNILGIWGIPASMMGVQDVGSYAKAKVDEYVFGRWIIKPRLNRYVSKLNAELCPDYDEELILDVKNPIPQDKDQSIKLATEGYKTGILTRNESRAELGYDPDELEGDTYYVAPAATNPFGVATETPIKSKGGVGSGRYPAGSGGQDDHGDSDSQGTQDRRQRAKDSYKPASKAVQSVADQKEQECCALIKGVRTSDNAPLDVIKGNNGIEVKAIVSGKNPKITMHKPSLARKVKYGRVNKLQLHTVAFHTPTNTIYYKKGVGSYNLSAMQVVTTSELAEMF